MSTQLRVARIFDLDLGDVHDVSYVKRVRYEAIGSAMTCPNQIPQIIMAILGIMRKQEPQNGYTHDDLCGESMEDAYLEGIDFDMGEILGIMYGEGMVAVNNGIVTLAPMLDEKEYMDVLVVEDKIIVDK